MKKNVLVLLPLTESHKARLQQALPEGEFRYDPHPSAADAAWAHIILGCIDPALLPGAKDLQWLQLNYAGTDGYTVPGLLPPDAILTNATGAYGLAVAEHMAALTLAVRKKLHLYRDNQSRQVWTDEGPVRAIARSTVLVVGLGDIGGSYASMMKGLGARVIGVRRRPSAQKPDCVDELYSTEELDRLLPEADIVAIALPGTPQTRGLFSKERLAEMKRGALLINGGRGYIVDSFALADALNSGALGGAGLDVTDPEPLPEGHPLWTAKNALITPHISGGYHLQETLEFIVDLCEENLRRFAAGQPLRSEVDFATGYRK